MPVRVERPCRNMLNRITSHESPLGQDDRVFNVGLDPAAGLSVAFYIQGD